MAWIYLAESEDSRSPLAHGCEQSLIVKTIDMPNPYSCPGCGKDLYVPGQSGTMYKHCGITTYPVEWTLFQEGSHAKTLVLQDLERAWQESEAGLYSNFSESLATFDLDSFSWKTPQLSLFGESTEFFWNSMRFGMMRDGRLYQPQRLEPRTYENEYSFLPGAKVRPSLSTMARKGMLPTLTASESDHGGPGRTYGDGSPTLSSLVGGPLSPMWCEWFMGYPIGWTELGDLEMQWYRPRRGKRSKG